MRLSNFCGSAALLLGIITVATPARAAIEPRAILKTYFETGDVPTQEQFGTLIDSFVNGIDDRYLIGLREYDPGSAYLPGDIKRFGIGDTTPVNPLGYVLTGSTGTIRMAPDFAGNSGFAALLFTDAGGSNLYYGYLQLSMDAATPGVASDPGPAIHVDYLVWERDPGVAITMEQVPEPASLGLVSLVGFAALRRRMR